MAFFSLEHDLVCSLISITCNILRDNRLSINIKQWRLSFKELFKFIDAVQAFDTEQKVCIKSGFHL